MNDINNSGKKQQGLFTHGRFWIAGVFLRMLFMCILSKSAAREQSVSGEATKVCCGDKLYRGKLMFLEAVKIKCSDI